MLKRYIPLPTLLIFIAHLCSLGVKLNADTPANAVATDQPWSIRMAESLMKRSPEAWAMRPHKGLSEPKWGYTYGLALGAVEAVHQKHGGDPLHSYVKTYVDQLIDENGAIKDYHIWDFNIDSVNAGKLLFDLYERYDDPRYLKAMQDLRTQLKWQPTTSEGGYWHKRYYPWQMWLDGLYMGAAYQARYAATFGEPAEAFDQIVKQFVLIESKVRDPETGLLYHAWDESKLQLWADPETGLSPHFWSRAMGWYAMALVDTLEQMPEGHHGIAKLEAILKRLMQALEAHQDDSGLWYQVVDLPEAKGNYLEASGTCMFAYAAAKGVRLGYLANSYQQLAEKAFDGVLAELITVDEDGEVHLDGVCGSAGLGGTPHYRDGSFAYYISEPIVRDDAHGVGPFILAALELGR
ncbi:glycoside hydrolase family 88/105 protein [Pelagicoccus albus]|uniref:Glycoside hydrolase family 88 protein n=1 Tax=Pelagicoccus albus TaxID=415222 RepID=A0A7X1E8E8_9BACT|nr:glycoside hydrolase family 88 protein [Pelagicoccus albus]MBC2606725.1 glycoside hydrolase family 88 protein [Pelagicoccus albus]